jgi:Uma2 family endonuclease
MSRMESKKPVTIDDMYHMPKDGQKYELVDGEVVVSPTGMHHAEIVTNIVYILATFLHDHPIGKVYGDNVGLIFPNGNLRSPDVSFVRMEKLPEAKSPVTFGKLVPDFAVEVLSPDDRPRLVADKIGEFLESGVLLVWVVDPKTQTVTAYRSLSNIQQFTSTDTISAEPVLPGFTCLVSRFFNESAHNKRKDAS